MLELEIEHHPQLWAPLSRYLTTSYVTICLDLTINPIFWIDAILSIALLAVINLQLPCH
jgi:hypothetical protein